MAVSPYIVDVTEADFETAVLARSQQVPVLADFWADWCAPCKMLMPILAQLAEAYQGTFILAKIDTEREPALAQRFAIRSLPTVKLFRHGTVVDEFMGVQDERQLRAFIDAHIERPSDALLTRAAAQAAQGDCASARALVDQAAQTEPNNPRLPAARAEVLLACGDLSAAREALAVLPADRQTDNEIERLRIRIEFAEVAAEVADPEALQNAVATPADDESRYRLSALRVMRGDFEGALELLLAIVKHDRSFRDDAARKAMVAIFKLLGDGDPLVARYRSRMSAALY